MLGILGLAVATVQNRPWIFKFETLFDHLLYDSNTRQ